MLTSDPQFARATVNLLWAEMFGVGIVEPVFSFDLARLDPKNPPPAPWGLQPSHPELLEALAQYFRDNNYSIRSVVKLIAKSNAYQLSSQFPGEWKVELCAVLRAQVRAPAESGGSLRFARRRDESLLPTCRSAAPTSKCATRRRRTHRTSSSGNVNDPILKEIHFFLESFGQTNRQSSERSNDGAITQAVQLMNSPLVHRQIKAAEGSYVAGLLKQDIPDDEKIVAALPSASWSAGRRRPRSPTRKRSSRAVPRMGRPAVAAGQR